MSTLESLRGPESDATGQIQREYLWLDGTPLAVLQ